MTEDKQDELRQWSNGLFMGIPIRQWPADLYYWELFFNKYPIKTMVELGTGSGGLSLFFMFQSIQHHFGFETFDNTKSQAIEAPLGLFMDFEYHFHLGDIFEGEKQNVIELLTKTPAPRLLFCDNGWKPKEMEMFSPYLSPGDFIAVHDWETEIYPKSIPYDILEDITTTLSPDMWSLTRWFIRKK